MECVRTFAQLDINYLITFEFIIYQQFLSQVLYFLGNACLYPDRNKRKKKVFRFLDALAVVNSAQVGNEDDSDAEEHEDPAEEEMRRCKSFSVLDVLFVHGLSFL